MVCNNYSKYKKQICNNDKFYIDIKNNCMKIYCVKCGKLTIKTII